MAGVHVRRATTCSGTSRQKRQPNRSASRQRRRPDRGAPRRKRRGGRRDDLVDRDDPSVTTDRLEPAASTESAAPRTRTPNPSIRMADSALGNSERDRHSSTDASSGSSCSGRRAYTGVSANSLIRSSSLSEMCSNIIRHKAIPSFSYVLGSKTARTHTHRLLRLRGW